MRADPLSPLKHARVLLVAAHPDDEVLGASSLLVSNPRLAVAHATDGSPRSLYDARRYGFETAQEYAAERRRELAVALETLGAGALELIEFGFTDQELTRNLPQVTGRVREALRECRAEVLLTHPYEGGHPDHDACAFAVHAAAAHSRIPVLEFTSYHAGPEGIRTGEFLQSGPAATVEFSQEERQRKTRALACFVTQQETLQQFGTERERFRLAPQYDFTAPPHDGQLFYERFDWGATGEEFRRLAAAALAEPRAAA